MVCKNGCSADGHNVLNILSRYIGYTTGGVVYSKAELTLAKAGGRAMGGGLIPVGIGGAGL